MTYHYDPRVTARKALIQGLLSAAGFAVLQALATMTIPTTLDEWKAQWPALLAGLASAAVRGIANASKHYGKPMRTGPAVYALAVAGLGAALMASSGCRTINRQIVEQATVDPVTGETYRDRMEQVNSAGPFGKAEALQDARWQYAPGEYVSLGSDATADNTAQVQAVQVAGDLAARVIAQVLAQSVPVLGGGDTGAPGGVAGTVGGVADAIAQVQRLAEQVQALRDLYGSGMPQRPKSAVGPNVGP